MPLGLLKYGFAGRYPACPDLPPSKDLEPSYNVVIIGAEVFRHGRYVTFQLAEVVVPRNLFREIPRRVDELRRRTAPA